MSVDKGYSVEKGRTKQSGVIRYTVLCVRVRVLCCAVLCCAVLCCAVLCKYSPSSSPCQALSYACLLCFIIPIKRLLVNALKELYDFFDFKIIVRKGEGGIRNVEFFVGTLDVIRGVR